MTVKRLIDAMFRTLTRRRCLARARPRRCARASPTPVVSARTAPRARRARGSAAATAVTSGARGCRSAPSTQPGTAPRAPLDCTRRRRRTGQTGARPPPRSPFSFLLLLSLPRLCVVKRCACTRSRGSTVSHRTAVTDYQDWANPQARLTHYTHHPVVSTK